MPEQQKQKEEGSEHEYELIPVSPLRRLEKRIDDIEKQTGQFDSKEFYRELVDIIRMNQQLVDELAKANDSLRIELSRLPGRLEDLTSKIEELVSFIKASANEEAPAGGISSGILPPKLEQLALKMDELISYIKAAANEENPLTTMATMPANMMASSPVVDMGQLAAQMNELVETNKKIAETNQSLLSEIEDMQKKMKKPMPPPPPMRRPALFPPRPI